MKNSSFLNFLVYLISTILGRLPPFILLPILTNVMPTDEYGRLSFILAVSGLILPLVNRSLSRILDNRFYRRKKDQLSVIIFNSITLMMTISAFLFILLSLLNAYFLAKFSFLEISIIIVFVITNSCFIYLSVVFRNLREVKLYALANIMKGFFELVIVCLIVFFFKGITPEVRMISMAASIQIVLLVMFVILKNKGLLSFNYNLKITKKLYSMSTPLMVHGFSAAILIIADRLLIEHYVGSSELGIYSVAITIGGIVSIIQNSFTNVSEPWLLQRLSGNSDNKLQQIKKFFFFHHVISIILVFILSSILSMIVEYILPFEYIGSTSYILYIMLGFTFKGMAAMYIPLIVNLKLLHLTPKITLLTGVVSLILNFIYVPTYGALAASYVFSIVYALYFILFFTFTYKSYTQSIS